jgi:hypothetical protein
MPHLSTEMQACVEECLRCYSVCLSTAMNHCLDVGGEHVPKEHFTLMMECAEICRTSAHFMLLGSPHHKHTCAECAEDCARIGDMQECVDACRRCAESCREMAA